jgi:glycosyltransferase involved in cell wall biosynthesis
VRTIVVSTAFPNVDSGSGASIVLEVLASSLAAHGHEVALCPVVFPEYVTPDGVPWERQLIRAQALGLETEPVVSTAWGPNGGRRRNRLSGYLRAGPGAAFPVLADAPAVAAAVTRLEADAVLAYGFEAIAASSQVLVPRLGATSDPPHRSLLERTRRRWLDQRRFLRVAREAPRLQALVRERRRLSVELARACDGVGAFGLQNAEWLRHHGIDCRYLRTPVPDPGRPRTPAVNDIPRLLLVGHLHGTSTIDGLRVFKAMLPRLERTFGVRGFNARIAGGYDLPRELESIVRHPSVTMLGHIDDIDREFREADVLIVPVSITLGVRVRILTGFAHGCCVVAHTANAAGIPELAHECNALLAASPAGLVREVVRVLEDRALNARLREAARVTYERYFAPDVAVTPIANLLEALPARP